MNSNEIIETFLNHNDPLARRQAIEGIKKRDLADKKLISIIINGLKDADFGVKDAIARLLSYQTDEIAIEISGQIIPFIESMDIELRNLSGEILKETGKFCPEIFIPYINDNDPNTVQFSIDIVSEYSADCLKPFLLELMNHVNDNIRSSAIEALGNYSDEDLLDTFINRFEFENDLKPTILVAIGKVKNSRAEQFLIECFSKSDDIFIKISCLDELSYFSDNIDLAEELYANLLTYTESIQTLLLKVIYSIFERKGINRVISFELRQIALNAILENDIDINKYGLISLGNIYYPNEIKELVDVVFKDNYFTQKLVLENLILYNTSDLIKGFFIEYFSNPYKCSCESNLLSLIHVIINENPDSKLELMQFQNIILEQLSEKKIILENIIFDMLESIDPENYRKYNLQSSKTSIIS